MSAAVGLIVSTLAALAVLAFSVLIALFAVCVIAYAWEGYVKPRRRPTPPVLRKLLPEAETPNESCRQLFVPPAESCAVPAALPRLVSPDEAAALRAMVEGTPDA